MMTLYNPQGPATYHPQGPATPSMGFGGRLMEWLRSPAVGALAAGLLSGRNVNEQLALGFGGASEARNRAREENRTREWLRQNRPDLADAPLPIAMKLLAQSRQGGDGVYGTPIYGQDAEGNPTVGVITKSGEFKPLDTGDVTVTPSVQWLDTGTEYQPVSKRTGRPVTGGEAVPIDKRTPAMEAEIGKAQGKRYAGSPEAVEKADAMLEVIENIKMHPGRETGTGLSSVLDPRNFIRGSDAADFYWAKKQLDGQVYSQAYEDLKGGGQITEYEGKQAAAAKAQLETAQSDQQFLDAILTLERITRKARDRALRGVKIVNGEEVSMGAAPSGASLPDPLGIRN